MKSIVVRVTDEEYNLLKAQVDFIKSVVPFCGKVGISSILSHYVSDLTESQRSSGSDERMYAYQYFERDLYNY